MTGVQTCALPIYLFRKTLRGLQSICSNRGILPRSYIIQGERISKKGQPVAPGGFADTHEAELDGERAYIKVLRLYILDTAGVTTKVRPCFFFISGDSYWNTRLAGVLQRSCYVEEVTTSQHRPFPRSSRDDTTVRDRLWLDGEWHNY